MTGRLVHFSSKPLGEIKSTKPVRRDGRYDKPRGLWVSVEGGGDSWFDWCQSERWGLDGLVHATEIKLRNYANILRVSGPKALDLFTKQYRIRRAWPHHDGIDWERVAAAHQGIIIAPYVWERRMEDHTFWYYGWDCASGCIWDKEAIASAQTIEFVPIAAEVDAPSPLPHPGDGR